MVGADACTPLTRYLRG